MQQGPLESGPGWELNGPGMGDRGSLKVPKETRARTWVRQRVRWFDWERKKDFPGRMILFKPPPKDELTSAASKTDTPHPKEWGDEVRGFFSIAYRSGAPGIYLVKAEDVPATVRDDLLWHGEHWRAQFGRRIADVTSVTKDSVKGSKNTSLYEINVDISRSSRRSPDGVFECTRPFSESPTVEDARAVYSEVAAAWRQLTEVRFKLLALLPVLTGVGLFVLLSPSSDVAAAPRGVRAGAAAFGLAVTAALAIYERRNSELYDDLISRGKHLEHHLGATSGVFLGRLGGRWPVRHDSALYLIYGATLLAWLLALVAVIFGWVDPASDDRSVPQFVIF